MPGPRQKQLSPSELEELDRASERIQSARKEWAETVRRLGVAACARAYGITPQAMSTRLKTVDRYVATRSWYPTRD